MAEINEEPNPLIKNNEDSDSIAVVDGSKTEVICDPSLEDGTEVKVSRVHVSEDSVQNGVDSPVKEECDEKGLDRVESGNEDDKDVSLVDNGVLHKEINGERKETSGNDDEAENGLKSGGVFEESADPKPEETGIKEESLRIKENGLKLEGGFEESKAPKPEEIGIKEESLENEESGLNLGGVFEESAAPKPEEKGIKEESLMEEGIGGGGVKEGSMGNSSDARTVGIIENKVEESEKKEVETSLEEADLVNAPSHWHPKACVRVTISDGSATEEELLSLFNAHATVWSIAFENEKRDAAIIRFDSLPSDDLVASRIQENLHNTQLGNRTLHVEPFKANSLLFVGNLTPDIDDSGLKNMFEPHGRVERAFVLQNPSGRSKGYGFVEYSLKSQAFMAKSSMNTVPMDGRVLRVEWFDYNSIRDLFSSILFVDRVTKHMSNVEASLRSLFGQYGKVKDLYVAIGVNGVSRGFAFIEFFNSAGADKGREALDGHAFGGLNLRVSFANPSKPVQSYKQRLASQGVPSTFGVTGRGATPAMQAPHFRGSMRMPYGGSHLIGAGRSSYPRMGLEAPFYRGAPLGMRVREQTIVGRVSSMHGSGGPTMGMMGQPPFLDSKTPQRLGVPTGRGYAPRPHSSSQGAQSINSGAIAQMAMSQAKAYEDEGRIRAQEYYKQAPQHMGFDQSKQNHSQYPHQQQPQQSYIQQPQKIYQQQSYHQPQQTYQQPQYQSLQQHSEYYAQPSESYATQPCQHQPSQQLPGSDQQFQQQYNNNQSYGKTYTPQYYQPSGLSSGSNTIQQYQQPAGSNTIQQYQQPAFPTQSEIPCAQPTYTDQYAQQQQQQQQPHQQTSQLAGGGLQFTAPTTGNQSQGTEAQWAAYYANQESYQQQNQAVVSAASGSIAGNMEVGQKRTYEQMNNAQQMQTPYSGYPSGYQQPSPYQSSDSYQQAIPGSQMAAAPPYAQPPAAYQQQPVLAADGYYQQQPPVAHAFDYNQRPRF